MLDCLTDADLQLRGRDERHLGKLDEFTNTIYCAHILQGSRSAVCADRPHLAAYAQPGRPLKPLARYYGYWA